MIQNFSMIDEQTQPRHQLEQIDAQQKYLEEQKNQLQQQLDQQPPTSLKEKLENTNILGYQAAELLKAPLTPPHPEASNDQAKQQLSESLNTVQESLSEIAQQPSEHHSHIQIIIGLVLLVVALIIWLLGFITVSVIVGLVSVVLIGISVLIS